MKETRGYGSVGEGEPHNRRKTGHPSQARSGSLYNSNPDVHKCNEGSPWAPTRKWGRQAGIREKKSRQAPLEVPEECKDLETEPPRP